MESGKDTDGNGTGTVLGLGDAKIFYYKKCSHTVSSAYSSPIANTNFANGLNVAGSSPVYLPVLNGPLQENLQ